MNDSQRRAQRKRREFGSLIGPLLESMRTLAPCGVNKSPFEVGPTLERQYCKVLQDAERFRRATALGTAAVSSLKPSQSWEARPLLKWSQYQLSTSVAFSLPFLAELVVSYPMQFDEKAGNHNKPK
jgi:hypothetical protein